ncbi:MAG: hypothetical protein GDA52_02075 [Rhodobacteraceae bacterium]|nr:hypothetical protein [Paracoccaceae bacterium]
MAVKSALVDRMINRGYNLTRDNQFTVAFDRPVENIFAAALLGSRYDSTPNARISYTIVENAGATRVVADMAIITNPGSAFERRTPMNTSQDSLGIQRILNDLKRTIEA